jgi:hypothetical protein
VNDDTRKRRRTLIPVALATLAAAVALPVSAALAGGEERSSGGSGTTLRQTQDRGQERPDHDCPEGRDGGSGSGSETTEL